jgi:hypothetical protein
MSVHQIQCPESKVWPHTGWHILIHHGDVELIPPEIIDPTRTPLHTHYAAKDGKSTAHGSRSRSGRRSRSDFRNGFEQQRNEGATGCIPRAATRVRLALGGSAPAPPVV